MVSNDTMYVPALLAPHPEWQGSLRSGRADGGRDAPQLIDRVIADKMMICGSHFPFPGTGTFVKDGNAYAFTPVSPILNQWRKHDHDESTFRRCSRLRS